MRFSLRPLFLASVFLLSLLASNHLALAATATPTPATAPITVMPLGDSLTAGLYRCELYGMLQDGGYNVDFVGGSGQSNSYCANPNITDFDTDHEGHVSATTGVIAASIDSYAQASPQIVLLMLGTNDVAAIGSNDPEAYNTSMTNLQKIINSLRAANPDVKIILSAIPPFADKAAAVSAYNSKLTSYFSGTGVYLIGQPFSTVGGNTGGDNIHPNRTGAIAIANNFYGTLSSLLDNTTPPTLTPTPPLTPTPTPIAVPTDITEQKKPCNQIGKETVYPPNGECYPTMDSVEADINNYALTCIEEPTVVYSVEYTGGTPPTKIEVPIVHDITEAQLGSFGPDMTSITNSTNPDLFAQKYLYNSLFDKPLVSLPELPREAFRTFWRLLSAKDQANYKAFYLATVGAGHKNLSWYFLNENGNKKEGSTNELKRILPYCLQQVPVCDTFAEVYLAKLPSDTKIMYDTLLPFDFDNARGYVVLDNQILREHIPYLAAIAHAISYNGGLFSRFTPDYLIPERINFGTIRPESLLDPLVLLRAIGSSCSKPPKSSSLIAPRTYPHPTTAPQAYQTVEVPLTSTLKETKAGFCGCDSVACETLSCSYYATSTTCSTAGCDWTSEEKKWVVTGTAKGKHLAVLNNPLVLPITYSVTGFEDRKIPSFYKMMTPDFSKLPELSYIAAPGAQASTEVPGASINGSNVIYRDSNYAQDSMLLLQGCWLIPGENQKSPKCGNKKPLVSKCDGQLFASIVGTPPTPSGKATSYFSSIIASRITEEVTSAYAEAEAATGVPCEVLAGIHFEEGGNDPTRSLQDGSPLGSKTLAESAIEAGNLLMAKVGGSISDINTLAAAMSRYNGGGNSNCKDKFACSAAASLDRCGLTTSCATDPSSCRCTPGLTPEPGSCRGTCGSEKPGYFAYDFNFPYCPQPEGFSDPYVVNWLNSPDHDNMYLLYQYDCTQSRPRIHTRPGSLTVAISLFLSEPK